MKASTWSTAMVTITLTTFLGVKAIDAQAPGSATRPTMTAKMIDPEKKAAEGNATVEVTTSGVALVDPSLSKEKPTPGQGHLHYQVDKGPVIASPAPKLSLHELAPGTHTITVVLVGNDHKPIGPKEQLTVTVPKAATKAGY